MDPLMLIQTTTPRPVFDTSKHPRYIHIHTLAKAGISEGTVRLSGTIDPEFGKTDGVVIEPMRHYPIEGEEGFEALEHVLPFWRLFQRPDDFQEARHDGVVVASADISIVRYCTPGFGVIIKSAFRASPRAYEEHTVALKLMFPATGGGVVRMGETHFDLANPTFDPWAPDPMKRLGTTVHQDLDMLSAYNRTHKIGQSSAIDARRAARVAAAEASMASSGTLPSAERPALPPKR